MNCDNGRGGRREMHISSWFVGDSLLARQIEGLSRGVMGDSLTCRGHPYMFNLCPRLRILICY